MAGDLSNATAFEHTQPYTEAVFSNRVNHPSDQSITALEKFKQLCRDHMVLHDDSYIDIIFGVIMGNRLDSKPIWLYLVGPAGGGKTEIVQTLEGAGREIYYRFPLLI